MGAAVERNFSIGVDGQMLTVRGAVVEQRCDGSLASGVGIGTPCHGNAAAFGGRRRWEIGTLYNARRRWMSRADVRWDPKICSTAPPRVSHSPSIKIPPWGGCSQRREPSRGVMDAAMGRNFSIGVGGQVVTVRKQRSRRDAMAAPRAAWNRYTVPRLCAGNAVSGAGGNRYTLQRSATLDEQS